MLAVTTAAKSRMLCQLADAKAEIAGLSGTGQDAKVTRLIIAASGYVAKLLGRDPWLQTYTWQIPGNGGCYLFSPVWPIKADPTSITLGTGSSPSTVTASTYSVAGERRDRFYRATEWSKTTVIEASPPAGQQLPEYTVNGLEAGWVMPDEITEWSDGGSFAANGWYSSTDTDHPLIFQPTEAGTFTSTEPSWPTVHEGTVSSTDTNDKTFTAYRQRLPEALEEAALMLVSDWFGGGLAQPSGIASEALEGARIEYMEQNAALSRAVLALVAAYR